jgi:serine/threonine protein kinase
VKPGNVLLEKGVDRAVLADFGLARAIDDATVTQYGAIAGTPAYMSPEQARGESIDPRSDLFSLGSVMYAMCCGVPPFRAETSLGVLRRISEMEPRGVRDLNPEIPPWLVRIIDRLQHKSPEKRFASASELAKLLEQCIAHLQQPTRIPLPAEVRSPWRITPAAILRAVLLPIGMAPLALFIYASLPPLTPKDALPPPSSAQRFPLTRWRDGTDEALNDLWDEAEWLETQISFDRSLGAP